MRLKHYVINCGANKVGFMSKPRCFTHIIILFHIYRVSTGIFGLLGNKAFMYAIECVYIHKGLRNNYLEPPKKTNHRFYKVYFCTVVVYIGTGV